MKVSDFKVFYNTDLLEPEVKIMFEKGLDYTEGSDDKLRNFKKLGLDLEERYNFIPKGRGKYIVWEIYYRKHDSSVGSFLKFLKVASEPITGRIHDMRNYLALLAAMIHEDGLVPTGPALPEPLKPIEETFSLGPGDISSFPSKVDKVGFGKNIRGMKQATRTDLTTEQQRPLTEPF